MYQRIGEDEAVKEGHRKRLLEQFSTILKGRDDICNIGIVQKDGVMLINSGYQATNPDLDLSTQEWYTTAETFGFTIFATVFPFRVIKISSERNISRYLPNKRKSRFVSEFPGFSFVH